MALLRVPLVVWCVMRVVPHEVVGGGGGGGGGRVKVVLRGLCHSPQVVVMPGDGLRHSPPRGRVAVVDEVVGGGPVPHFAPLYSLHLVPLGTRRFLGLWMDPLS